MISVPDEFEVSYTSMETSLDVGFEDDHDLDVLAGFFLCFGGAQG